MSSRFGSQYRCVVKIAFRIWKFRFNGDTKTTASDPDIVVTPFAVSDSRIRAFNGETKTKASDPKSRVYQIGSRAFPAFGRNTSKGSCQKSRGVVFLRENVVLFSSANGRRCSKELNNRSPLTNRPPDTALSRPSPVAPRVPGALPPLGCPRGPWGEGLESCEDSESSC